MKTALSFQEPLPLPSYAEMATALWANWYLLSLQAAHRMTLACLTVTAGSWAGTLKATRSYWEQSQSR